MKSLILIGGCNFSNFENKNINKRIIEESKKANPSLLYIPVSTKNHDLFIQNFKDLTNNIKLYEALEDIDNADIIYIGGGNTEEMIKRFNKEGITDKLISNLNNKVIAGMSAGAIFWFKKYYSDTYSYQDNFTAYNFKLLDGINYFNYYISPHFNEEGKENFIDEIDNTFSIALENNTALIINENSIDYMLDRNHSAIYYFIDKKMYLLNKDNLDIVKKYFIK